GHEAGARAGRAGCIWLGVPGGLVGFDGLGFRAFTSLDAPFGDDFVSCLEVSGRDLFIGTATALVRYRDGQFEPFGREHGLPDGRVLAIHVDRRGRMWVAHSNGLFALETQRFVQHTAVAPRPSRIAELADGTALLLRA